MSAPLTLRPEVPRSKVRSSTLIQSPGPASLTTATVHRPPLTVTGTTIRSHPEPETGRPVRCSAPPQSRRARWAEFWPPPERTQAVSR